MGAGWMFDGWRGERRMKWKWLPIGQPTTVKGCEFVACSILDPDMLAIVLDDRAEHCFMRMKDGQLIDIDKGVPKGTLVPIGEWADP